MKRIALFVGANLAIMVVLMLFLTVLSAVFGINFRSIGGPNLDIGALAVFSLVVGFTGAFISLLMSKWIAKRTTGARVIEQPANAMEAWLVDSVRRQAEKAGIGMPEVAIFEGDANAFATGAFKNSALVAVSTGLLQAMSKDEVEAVLAHEVSHIANGDMVTMTLLQGVMNTFVVFLSRVVGFFVDRVLLRNESNRPGIGFFLTTIVMDIALGFLAAIIVAWFSRRREFRADAGSVAIMGNNRPMINALARLGGLQPGDLPQQVKTFGIAGGVGSLFASHPPIEERIAALEARGR